MTTVFLFNNLYIQKMLAIGAFSDYCNVTGYMSLRTKMNKKSDKPTEFFYSLKKALNVDIKG